MLFRSNNEFDYPLGLPWLLFIVLVGFTFTSGFPRSPLLWASLLLWALWWMNAQQSRWLYPTLALGFLGTLNLQRKAETTLVFLVLLSSSLSLFSQIRSLKPSMALSHQEIQRIEESKVRWAPNGKLGSHELLYVNRPAMDHEPASHSVWVLR